MQNILENDEMQEKIKIHELMKQEDRLDVVCVVIRFVIVMYQYKNVSPVQRRSSNIINDKVHRDNVQI